MKFLTYIITFPFMLIVGILRFVLNAGILVTACLFLFTLILIFLT